MNHERYPCIDSAKVLMMTLGVVLHAAGMLSPTTSAMINFHSKHPIFAELVFWIHAFRMQAFFIIAGFMAAMMLTKYDPIRFLDKRSTRLLIPFCSVLVLINIPMRTFFLSDETFNPAHVAPLHLWFLPALMICSLIHGALFRPQLLAQLRFRLIIFNRVGIVAALVAAATFIYVAKRILWRFHLGDVEAYIGEAVKLSELATLLPCYCVGAVLYECRSQLNALIEHWQIHLTAALLFVTAKYCSVSEYAIEWLGDLFALAITMLFLNLGRLKFMQGFATAWWSGFTFTLYVLHLPFLFMLRTLVEDTFDSVWLLFIVATVGSILLCLISHYAIARSAVLAFLFNGETKPATKMRSASPQAVTT